LRALRSGRIDAARSSGRETMLIFAISILLVLKLLGPDD
jgi:hypothetical protein